MPTAVGTPSLQYQASSASNTFSHTVPATGARRALRVFVAAYNGGGGSITGVTYAGVSMTKVGSTYGTINSDGIAEQYILVNPATGANNVVISASGSLSEIMGIASSWEDVDQTTPTNGSNGGSGSGTAPSVSLTVTGSDVGVAGVEFFSANVDNPTESDTLLAEQGATAAQTGFADQYGDGTLSWTLGSSSFYATAGFVLVHDGGSAGSHPSSGALSAQASTIAGSAAHLTLHPTSGALASQAATVAGTAVHRTLHTTTGALSAQAATIAGSAAHQHATAGVLSAQAATLAGTAAHLTLHTSTGALSSQDATIVGAAAHEHAATGALAAQDATIAGAADHTTASASHSTSGALAAQGAALAGSAAHLTLHTTSGALAAQASTIAGVAAHQHATTGALAAQAATVAGSAAHLTLHTSSGALSSQASTISGAADHSSVGAHDAAGVLAAGDAIIVGFASRSGGAPGPGFFNEASGLPGTTAKTQPKTPRVKAPKAKAKAIERAVVVHDASGALYAGDASMFGAADLAVLIVQRGLKRSQPVAPYPQLTRENCSHCGAPMSAHRQP